MQNQAFTLSSDFDRKIFVTKLNLSIVLMENNADNPWLILVPMVNNVIDLTDLSLDRQVELLSEINKCAKAIKEIYKPYKLNIASLGNVTPQLHIHIQARFKNDRHFPKPLFGLDANTFATKALAQDQAALIKSKIF